MMMEFDLALARARWRAEVRELWELVRAARLSAREERRMNPALALVTFPARRAMYYARAADYRRCQAQLTIFTSGRSLQEGLVEVGAVAGVAVPGATGACGATPGTDSCSRWRGGDSRPSLLPEGGPSHGGPPREREEHGSAA